MPSAPKRWCSRCSTAHGGKCPEASRTEEQRPSAAKRGYGWWWRNPNKTGMADRWIAENPLCAECAKSGRVEPGFAVDHVVPHRGDEALLKDWNNLQTLCKSHHAEKSARERW